MCHLDDNRPRKPIVSTPALEERQTWGRRPAKPQVTARPNPNTVEAEVAVRKSVLAESDGRDDFGDEPWCELG